MEDESELGEETAAESGLLDNLLLTVRVELPARRISLEELTRLRAGQILDLDCRATDPVELVADGRSVATGELVDIEGRLGVRVTRLAG
jgi:flagellar motor switch/type III secretory pathway protein FliN